MWQTTAFSIFSPLAEQFALQESDLLIRPSDFRDLNPVGRIQRGKNNMCRSHLTTVTCPKQLSDSGYKYNYFAVDWFEKHSETMSLDINNELDKEKGSSASCCGTVAVRWSYYYHHLQMYFHKVANINTTRYTWFTFRLLSVLSKLADGYARHALVLSLVYIHLCKHDITEIIRWKQFFFFFFFFLCCFQKWQPACEIPQPHTVPCTGCSAQTLLGRTFSRRVSWCRWTFSKWSHAWLNARDPYCACLQCWSHMVLLRVLQS